MCGRSACGRRCARRRGWGDWLGFDARPGSPGSGRRRRGADWRGRWRRGLQRGQLELDLVQMAILRLRGRVKQIAKVAPGLLQIDGGMLESGALRGGSSKDGGLGHAHQDVIERLDIAIRRQQLCHRAGVGRVQQRRQGGVEVALDGTDVGDGLGADRARGLPLLRANDEKRLLNASQRGLKDGRRRRSRERRLGSWRRSGFRRLRGD